VLDNRSPEDDAGWVAKHYPDVEVVVAPQNDFLFSYNWFLSQRTEDVVVILNNDLRLAPGFLKALLVHFSQPDVFSVGATSRDWDDTQFTCGPARLRSHRGVYSWDWDRRRQQRCHTLFTSGGFMAVDREKFLVLGGFNRLFHPAYGEDLDLCFRAWRRGWRCIFEPASLVYHRESASWSENADNRAARMMVRAALLFQWSSLPATAGGLERAAMWVLSGFRQVARGNTKWPLTWLATWREWRRARPANAGMKTSKEELQRVLRLIEQPVPK
jgi:GT2 family glycosyltransferase